MQDLVPETTTIVGRPEEVAAALRRQIVLGHLVTHPSQIRVRERGDGLAEARVTVLTKPKPLPPPPWSKRHPVLAALAAATAWAFGLLTLFGVTVFLLVSAVRHAMSGIDRGSVLGFAVIAAVLLIAINRSGHSGVCPGLHCKGCKHAKR